MPKKLQRVYLLSYGFYSAPLTEGGFAPVNTTVLVDVDGGRLITRLITDFSKWTKDTYEVSTRKQGGMYDDGHQWQVDIMPPWKEPIQIYVNFEFLYPEKNNYQYSFYPLNHIFRTLLMNCSNKDVSDEWKETADKTMDVVIGYHLL